jgi:hypothetical protein
MTACTPHQNQEGDQRHGSADVSQTDGASVVECIFAAEISLRGLDQREDAEVSPVRRVSAAVRRRSEIHIWCDAISNIMRSLLHYN